MAEKIKLNSEEICPCGTGEKYRNCCWEKDFEWMIDNDGNLVKAIPLTAESIEVLEGAKSRFMEIFNREPNDNDPIFLEQYFYNDDDIKEEAVNAMHRAQIPPEFIYAYEKTDGLIITEENWGLLSKKDQQAWEEAIQEYFELNGQREIGEIELIASSIIKDLEVLVIVFGYIMDNVSKDIGEVDPENCKYISMDSYIVTCAMKSFKTIRAIKFLLDRNIGSDSLALARSIYESYLHIIGVKSKPEYLETLFALQLGIKIGTHEYLKNSKGQIDRRKLVRLEDGQRINGYISMYKMAESTGDSLDTSIFDGMYEFLSEFTHAGVSLLMRTESLNTTDVEFKLEASFYTSVFSVFILVELLDLKILTASVKRDIIVVIRKTIHNLLMFYDVALQNESAELLLLKEKVERILNSLS